MCISPITINRTYPVVGTKSYTVPCGKCVECTNKKRSELAALSVHQAMVSGDVRFFTLTYNNEMCPVAIYDPTVRKIVGFERGVSRWMRDGKFFNDVHVDKKRNLLYTPSLCREDVKLWLKQFRSAIKRKCGEAPKFKYCFFGEYGDSRGRPHVHGLVYGLSPEYIEILKDLWVSRFGFVYVAPDLSRKVTLDEVTAISQYVSKYISKGVHQRFAFLLDYVEKPRRQSSIDFGQFSDEELCQYANFIMEAISFPILDFLQLTNFLALRIDANISRLTALALPSRSL